MAFNIQQFISRMKFDGLRPNLFEIVLPSFTGSAETFTLRARATSIPASTIGIASTFYFGRQAKFAGNRTFADWTVTVQMDEDDFAPYGARGQLEYWSSLLNTHIGNQRVPGFVPPASYMRNADIIMYGKDNRVISNYRMIECFPVDVGGLPVDWSSNDNIAEFSVTFAMQWWESISFPGGQVNIN